MGALVVSSRETSVSLAAIVAEVDGAFPEWRARTSPEGMVTIVFTDIESSTDMLERLGEEQWLEIMREHNRIVRACADAHDGDVVKSSGDGYLITFASARAALGFGVELQRRLARRNESSRETELRVRVGMHTGNVFATEEDLLGRAVVLAARITGRAQGGQILISSACREYTRHLGGWHYGKSAEMTLKGLVGVERVYELEWAS